MRIAIIGGGLGGLAAALFLHRAGIEATVYEQAPALGEVGAGIVVSPNMVRLLERVQLAARLSEFAVRLDAAWEFRRWQDGRVLFAQPMGEACEQLYGTHCYVAHRADLHALLHAALPPDRVRLDHRYIGVHADGGAARIEFSNSAGHRSEVEADAVIGADGIQSRVRSAIGAQAAPRFSGLCAYRCLVPAQDAPPMALRPVHSLWLGPGRHFVHYPIRPGALVNVVAIVPAGEWRTESWSADGDIGELASQFAGWDDRVLQLIRSAQSTKRWALYDREPLESWTRGRITLLGDAAHAMLPFFAQGAAQAIEDAYVLAQCLRHADAATVPEALRRYEARRRPRTNEVLLMSRGREVRNHLPDGPEQVARDAAFGNGDPLRQSAWLYGHDPDTEVT